MKVYEVVADVNHFQSLLLEKDDINPSGLLRLNCQPMAATWKPPQTFCLYTQLPKGDFAGFIPGTLMSSPETTNKVRAFYEMAGELLPLVNEGVEYTVLNITECINCLDSEKSEWLLTETGSRALLKRYAFHKNRFVESSLFKVPETCNGTVLTYERSGDPEEEFKAFVETHNLTGLIFKLLWSDD